MHGWTRSKVCSADSMTGNCVEARNMGSIVILRDSTATDISLYLDRSDWESFIVGIKNGDFDQV